MYIVFEGVDCLGKTTQIELLKNEFRDVIFTKEPGGTAVGLTLRELLLKNKLSKKTEMFLFLADRAQHYKEILAPNLEKTIISDRSFISGIAYAMGDFDLDFLLTLNKFAVNDLLPDRVVFFKGERELIEKRLGSKNLDVIEKRGIEYFLQIQSNIEKIVKKLEIPTLPIDASRTIDEINRDIRRFLCKQ